MILNVKSSLLNGFSRHLLVYHYYEVRRYTMPVFFESQAVGISILPFKKASYELGVKN